ncbi:MAG: tetratricopeptide repeat protein [Elusimicrobia bacterium]|nr:tetratricopeptide repeat protein [Elusimicrobiota bacterium]
MPDSTWLHSGTTEAPKKLDLAFAWIKGHRETVIGSLVILCGIAIFSLWFFFHYSDLREAAWKNLFIAQQVGYMGNFGEAAKQLDAIETNYQNTSAYGFAMMTKGDFLFKQNKFKEAADEYAVVAKQGSKNLLPFAVYNLGKAREAASDLAGAQEQYKDFLAKYPDHFMAPEAHFSLARTYELTRNQAETQKTYEKIVLLYPETAWAAAAKAKLTPEVKK